MSLVAANFLFASDLCAFRSVDVFFNVRLRSLALRRLNVLSRLTRLDGLVRLAWLDALFRLTGLDVFFRLGCFLLLGLLLLLVSRRLRADRQNDGKPHRY